MNRFAMNRRAQEAAATAHRWSSTGHHTVAHAAAAMAQAARNWRG
jgi:NADH:ubiquinone oxidoreductase subunit